MAQAEKSEGEKVGQGQAIGRVEDLLIRRLMASGLRKPRGMSVGDFELLHGALRERLAYLTDENLMTLAEALVDSTAGTDFPPERFILQLAHSMQAPPESEARVVSSWLASVEGPQAEARGDLAELYRFLRKHRRPPTSYERGLIAGEAGENQRRVQIVRSRIDRDVAQAEDRSWLASYEADLATARAHVDGGRARRRVG